MTDSEFAAERSFRAREEAPWRGEPFRLLFPLGVLLGWVGIGHWLLYALGATATYSCELHGTVQMQAFMMAFASGFLLTAIPRRTRGALPSRIELASIMVLLCGTVSAALVAYPVVAQVAYAGVFFVLLQFALRRFVGRAGSRRPPAAFVLVPLGMAHGLGGAGLIVAAQVDWVDRAWWGLGRLLVEQGVFLCWVVGVGGLVLPLIAGAAPPPDLDATPRERWKAVLYLAAGLTIFASLIAEHAGSVRGGPLLRAAVLLGGLGVGSGAWRPSGKPGLHRTLARLAVWLLPVGLLGQAIWPDMRIAALHVTFIGGFSLMAFAVAAHVTFGHLGMDAAAAGRPAPIAAMGLLLVVAMAARVAADWSDSYFVHLGWAAALWLAASLVWLGFLGPSLLRPGRDHPAAR